MINIVIIIYHHHTLSSYKISITIIFISTTINDMIWSTLSYCMYHDVASP
jgi:hypothetical protein